MIVKILGPGCRNCHTLEERTREALTQLGLDAEIEAVTDYTEIARYGVMKTPGLVVDEDVVVAGKVPSVKDLTRLLTPR